MYGFAVVLVVATQLVERVGRRPIWLVSIGSQTICFAIFTALSGVYASNKVPAVGIASIPFIYLFFGFYVACWSTVAPMCKCGHAAESSSICFGTMASYSHYHCTDSIRFYRDLAHYAQV
jgi:MFS family permease